jgi:hypothetical protein
VFAHCLCARLPSIEACIEAAQQLHGKVGTKLNPNGAITLTPCARFEAWLPQEWFYALWERFAALKKKYSNNAFIGVDVEGPDPNSQNVRAKTKGTIRVFVKPTTTLQDLAEAKARLALAREATATILQADAVLPSTVRASQAICNLHQALCLSHYFAALVLPSPLCTSLTTIHLVQTSMISVLLPCNKLTGSFAQDAVCAPTKSSLFVLC